MAWASLHLVMQKPGNILQCGVLATHSMLANILIAALAVWTGFEGTGTAPTGQMGGGGPKPSGGQLAAPHLPTRILEDKPLSIEPTSLCQPPMPAWLSRSDQHV